MYRLSHRSSLAPFGALAEYLVFGLPQHHLEVYAGYVEPRVKAQVEVLLYYVPAFDVSGTHRAVVHALRCRETVVRETGGPPRIRVDQRVLLFEAEPEFLVVLVF